MRQTLHGLYKKSEGDAEERKYLYSFGDGLNMYLLT